MLTVMVGKRKKKDYSKNTLLQLLLKTPKSNLTKIKEQLLNRSTKNYKMFQKKIED